MIITRRHALKLIRAGRATINGAVYEPDYRTGERDAVILIRPDMSRVDHYDYSAADKAAVDAVERRYAAVDEADRARADAALAAMADRVAA